jgi:antitoxin ParD1/3/4
VGRSDTELCEDVGSQFAVSRGRHKKRSSRIEIVTIKTRLNHLLSIMAIALNPEQEEFIQAQLSTGQYTNAAAVITEALRLLEKRNHYDEWVEDVRAKIDTAATQLDRGEDVDGETAIAQLREKLK